MKMPDITIIKEGDVLIRKSVWRKVDKRVRYSLGRR
jgi:hypothetical protein